MESKASLLWVPRLPSSGATAAAADCTRGNTPRCCLRAMYGTTIRSDTVRGLPRVIDRCAQRHHVAFVQAKACDVVAVHKHDHARAMDATKAIVVAIHCGVELIVAAQRDELHDVTPFARRIDVGVPRVSGVMKFARPVMTAAEAMREGAPLVHERLASVTNVNIRPGGLLPDDDPHPWLRTWRTGIRVSPGGCGPGLPGRGRDRGTRRRVHLLPMHQGYIEPHSGHGPCGTVTGTLTIWSSSSGALSRCGSRPPDPPGRAGVDGAAPYAHGDWRGLGGEDSWSTWNRLRQRWRAKTGRPVKVTMSRDGGL